MTESPRVGVLGATSLVGRCLLPLLVRRGRSVLAVSRAAAEPAAGDDEEIVWCRPGSPRPGGEIVPRWIALCPLWAVPAQAAWLERLGCRRLVALSSMSLVTKASSPDPAEREVAGRLAGAEADVASWADSRGIRLTILRPTMIYDGERDGNVAAIVAWVSRFGWFPLCGPASGLRQPVHAGDVAAASLAALEHDPEQLCYPLSGGEALPFRELVVRTCRAHGLVPRTVSVPARAWTALAAVARGLGIARGPLAGVGQRMNEDLSCSHAAAASDFGFRPRPFVPGGSPAAESAGLVNLRPLGPRVQR
jgi:uncharacterized protein YbjT (DUF2867 family)